MTRLIHLKTEMKIDISPIKPPYLDIIKETKDTIKNIGDTLREIWPDTYFADLDVEEYIPIVTELWIKNYIDSPITKEALDKTEKANPPQKLKIYLVFNLLDDDDNLIITESESSKSPLFRAYLPTDDLWDTYIYDIKTKKFESLEIIEPSYIEEIKQSLSEKEKMDLDELLLQSYGFHNRLLGILPRKIRLFTAQPEERINEWNTKKIIPKGVYLTNKLQRAEYYFNPEEHDVIVYYNIPEDKVVLTSDFGGAKEYVSIENIKIK